ncbi:MAG: hypothetical protein L0Z62_04475 [Gemmataceae bacterium]|nr:hypothetical protein [Gemmataceae bacterium]
MKRVKWWLALLPAAALAAGCGEVDTPSTAQTTSPVQATVNAPARRLAAEPAGAKGVIEVRKHAKDGEEVVVVGRIGGSKEPLVKGRAAFTIVDPSLEPCEDDTPWVYCCTPREELAQGMVYVKFVDGQGRTLAQDARQLLGVKELSTVVVRGQARRDESGNLTAIVASGLYVRQ